MAEEKQQAEQAEPLKPHRRGWLALKFTAFALLGGLAIFGIGEQVKKDDKARVVDQTVDAVFTGKNDLAFRYDRQISNAEDEVNWIRRHNLMMQDTAKAAEFKAWLSQFEYLKSSSHLEKITMVNKVVGRQVSYTPEEFMYGKKEYLSPPAWTASKGVGDCDDFAILQYYVLKYLGYKDNKCFVAAVSTQGTGTDHAVAVVDTSGQNEKLYRAENMFILDNGGILGKFVETTFTPVRFINRSGSYPVKYTGVMRSEGALR